MHQASTLERGLVMVYLRSTLKKTHWLGHWTSRSQGGKKKQFDRISIDGGAPFFFYVSRATSDPARQWCTVPHVAKLNVISPNAVEWVKSHKNRADALTPFPSKWLSRVKETESPIAPGAVPVRPVTGALTLEQIKIAQKADPEICAAVESLLKGEPFPGSFSRMKSQLVVDNRRFRKRWRRSQILHFCGDDQRIEGVCMS